MGRTLTFGSLSAATSGRAGTWALTHPAMNGTLLAAAQVQPDQSKMGKIDLRGGRGDHGAE